MRIRTLMEQTVVYGILLLLLALLILFGIAAAERGVNALVGVDNPQALAVDAKGPGETDLKILGKDLSTSQAPWADQMSDDLDKSDSSVADAVDGLSLNVGQWMQAGAKRVLDGISSLVLGD
ncbi:MAG TPA: DUF3679 domain-containing protein [Bacilli bacterium]|nr:DUF3679 domain-containing protein [Bacilli bacterium]